MQVCRARNVRIRDAVRQHGGCGCGRLLRVASDEDRQAAALWRSGRMNGCAYATMLPSFGGAFVADVIESRAPFHRRHAT